MRSPLESEVGLRAVNRIIVLGVIALIGGALFDTSAKADVVLYSPEAISHGGILDLLPGEHLNITWRMSVSGESVVTRGGWEYDSEPDGATNYNFTLNSELLPWLIPTSFQVDEGLSAGVYTLGQLEVWLNEGWTSSITSITIPLAVRFQGINTPAIPTTIGFELRLIPAPMSAALFGVAALTVSRRRR